MKTILRFTIYALLMGLVFATIQRNEFSINSILIGSTHGALIGFFISLYILLRRKYLDYSFRKLPFLVISLMNTLSYLLIILVVRAFALVLTHGRAFQIFQFEDSKFTGAILFIFGSLLVLNLLIQISKLTGKKELFNLAIGRYHNVQQESRMIMYIDMADSTKIAEQIGDANYLSLLDECFYLMTNPLLKTKGEIYKYIGDEAIITWSKKQQNPLVAIDFFFRFSHALKAKERFLLSKYGVFSTFRAGLHVGSMMIGEIGDIKKEIALIGDSMNTAARVLGVGKTHNQALSISENIAQKLTETKNPYILNSLGQNNLKGKQASMFVYGVFEK